MDTRIKPTVFIHTNERQFVGAKVAEHALRKFSPNRTQFDIHILHTEDYPQLLQREGQRYLRTGQIAVWRNADLQSFTPLRFLPPQVCNYRGRALVIDPDVFACDDIYPLLSRPMDEYAILARILPSTNGKRNYASSVMLLDCSKLLHWRWEQQLEEMFSMRRDYREWISLRLEDSAVIGELEECWNQFDTLTPTTKLLHNTKRVTQPWKTGLKVDFSYDPPSGRGMKWGIVPRSIIARVKHWAKKPSRYESHPDPRQESYFVSLLRDAISSNTLPESDLRSAVHKKFVRPDIFQLLERV